MSVTSKLAAASHRVASYGDLLVTLEDDLMNPTDADLSVELLDDIALLSLTRQGNDVAYAVLYERYVYSARRLARHLGQRDETDDVVADAFAQILDLLRRGKGPDRAFRAYLFTTIRNDSARRAQAGGRVMLTDDETLIDRPVPFADGKLDEFEKSAIRAAYESLPERWRTVLWHLDVEGHRASDLADVLDLRPNSVSALVYRARSGLRDAYLRQHIGAAREPQTHACTGVRDKLTSVLRRTASSRDEERVRAHLGTCIACMDVYVALKEVNRDLGAILTPAAVAGALAGGVVVAGVSSGGAVLAQLMAVAKGLVVAAVPAAAATVTTVVVVDVIASPPSDTHVTPVIRTTAPSPKAAAPAPAERARSDEPIQTEKAHAASAPGALPSAVPSLTPVSTPTPAATTAGGQPSGTPAPVTPTPSAPSQPAPSSPAPVDVTPDAIEVTVEPVTDAINEVLETTTDLLSGLLPLPAPR